MSVATSHVETRPPVPPFTRETAELKVRLAEDGWNFRDPEKVALSYTPDSRWRNRAEFVNGRAEIIAFLKRKWAKELEIGLLKSFGILALGCLNRKIVNACVSCAHQRFREALRKRS